MGYNKKTWVSGETITKEALNNIENGISDLDDRVDQLKNSSSNSTGTSNLPSYWKNRLAKIGEKIEALQMENGMDTLQFLWCSDIHGVPGTSPNNTSYIGEIGRYLMDKHNIPFFAVSGDIMSQASHSNTNSIWNEYNKLIPMLSPINNEEFLAIRGNHDGMWGSPMEYNGQANQYYHSYIGDKALFNAFMRRQTLDRHKRVFGKNGMYFYVDYHNYRIYMLNTHTFGDNSVNEQGQAVYNGFKQDVFGSEQLQWIADTLMTVNEDQQVLFIGHAPITYMVDKDIFANMLVYYRQRKDYTASVDVSGTYWASGTVYSTSTVTKNFANAKGDFIGYFNGHIHSDSISMLGYVPMFSITTAGGDLRDSYLTDGTLTRVKGTATETAIDLVTVTSDFIYFTRIGSGYDRKYNRTTKEITIDYDSAYIPGGEDVGGDDENTSNSISLPEGSELYLNQRYSQSGGGLTTSNATGSFVVIIPINDATTALYTLSVSNTSSDVLNQTSCTLYRLDSSKACLGNVNGANYPCNMTSGVTFGSDNKSVIIEFSPTSDTKYMAFTCKNKMSVLTEEDVKDIVISLESQKSLTQGEITSEVTWKADTRLSSSSGNYSTQTGVYASNDIPVKIGDIIRFYGAKQWKYYAYVNAYSDSAFLVTSSMETNDTVTTDYFVVTKDDNNILTVTITNDAVIYIRVCGYDIEPESMRVFRNAELEESEVIYPSFINLIPADISDYVLNKKYSGTSIVDGGGYYLTPVYTFSGSITPYLNVEGVYGAGASVSAGITLYKVAFYKGSTCMRVEYTSNMGLPSGNNDQQSIDISSYVTDKNYDGIQLSFTVIGKSTITVNDIPVDGSVKATLSNTAEHFTLAVPNSTNTTNTDIWVNNYRFSSSGLSAETGTSVSNIIPVEKGDTIKISGVTLREGQDRVYISLTTANGSSGQAIAYFNNVASSGGVAVIEYKGYSDGVYTFYIPSTYAGEINYFRFAMPTPTDFSIVDVTINN